MDLNIEKQAKKHFDDIYDVINSLLNQTGSIDFSTLKSCYSKLKKVEDRQQFLNSFPLIRKMINKKNIDKPITSQNILKVAQFMKRCKVSQIDKTMFEFLKANKKTIYYFYFKEDYENEVININNQNDAYACLMDLQ